MRKVVEWLIKKGFNIAGIFVEQNYTADWQKKYYYVDIYTDDSIMPFEFDLHVDEDGRTSTNFIYDTNNRLS